MTPPEYLRDLRDLVKSPTHLAVGAVGSAQLGSTTGERMHALLEYIEATYRGGEAEAPQSRG